MSTFFVSRNAVLKTQLSSWNHSKMSLSKGTTNNQLNQLSSDNSSNYKTHSYIMSCRKKNRMPLTVSSREREREKHQ